MSKRIEFAWRVFEGGGYAQTEGETVAISMPDKPKDIDQAAYDAKVQQLIDDLRKDMRSVADETLGLWRVSISKLES